MSVHDDEVIAVQDRYDEAVEVVLDSGLMFPHMNAFWAYVDGMISKEDLIDEIR